MAPVKWVRSPHVTPFRYSSVVERTTVNRAVLGSSPSAGAICERCGYLDQNPRHGLEAKGNRRSAVYRDAVGSNPIRSAIGIYINRLDDPSDTRVVLSSSLSIPTMLQ